MGVSRIAKGLAITRGVHDRYSANKRNPYNEIECSDHYARSKASYGLFLALCGFEYNGSAGKIGFAPKLDPKELKCFFSTAEGWVSFVQTHAQRGSGMSHEATIDLAYGRLKLVQVALQTYDTALLENIMACLDDQPVKARATRVNDRIVLTFAEPIKLEAGQTLRLHLIDPGD